MDLHLYQSTTTLGWRIARRISFGVGERNVERGRMRRVLDSTGALIGYQFVGRSESRGDLNVKSMRTAASISLREMRVNAEEISHTEGLPEAARKERMAFGLAPEDRAERVRMKVRVFPRVGPAHGDILRVWPRGAVEPIGA